MEYRAGNNGADKRGSRVKHRRRVGRLFGIVGIVLAIVATFVAIFTTDLGNIGIVEAVVGVLFGIVGYFLGSRFFGNAAVITGLVALFIGFSASQNLF